LTTQKLTDMTGTTPFEPHALGRLTLANRFVMAPQTCSRSVVPSSAIPIWSNA
jgi:2,4-dienoyl-CoA reductase-like NADH-dependent reductase (Old Yellow Enzyme family)